jgi:hypothetical protein
MALLHSASTDALRSELDLWAIPSTQTSLEESLYVPYKPIASIDQSSAIEFSVPGNDLYIDPSHTLLYVKAKIVKADGTNFSATDNNDAAPVNYFLHALWNQVDVSINQKVVSQSSRTYPIRAQIESLLGYDYSAKHSHMTQRLWYKDTAGEMDAVTPGANEGLDIRRSFTQNSRAVEMMGPLHADFFNQDRFLLNNVELRVKLTRNKDAYMLMSTNGNERVVILDATLLIRKVRLSPSVLLAHAAALEKAPARYPVTRVDVKTVSITAGLRDQSIPSLHLGQIPKRIVIGFVTNEALNGSYRHNPFHFQSFDLNYLCLYVDSQQIPAQPLTPDFQGGNYIEAYNTLFSGSGIHWRDEGNDITYTDYGSGYALYCFDLTSDLSAHQTHWNLQKSGCVRLEVRFNQPLAVPINCIVYSEFNNLIEIDKSRNVLVDYSL